MYSLKFIASLISRFLPVWIVALACIAYFFPDAFRGFRGWTGFGLGAIFLLMGMQLATTQLIAAIKHPKNALIGIILKWTVMVGVSIGVAYLFFGDYPEVAIGVILSGTVPSGTSANLFSFIAGGDVALSITMATLDTIISPVLTPSLTQLFAGQLIPIEFWSIFLNIIYIVFIPLFLGVFLQWKFSHSVNRVKPYTSILSQLALFLIIVSVISSAQSSLEENLHLLPLIGFAVLLQVSIPMFGGYYLAKVLKVGEAAARSILFQTGICNTALAATLALEHVSSLAAVPAVVNMVINLTLGAIMSNYFAQKHKVVPE
ncbi:bile acid:sodium symporter [Psychrobacillus psychrodurans]|uniref:bile acid:sodium symporter n=1 Tax=Psychrobacillus psychrodurans TaxID=126157 RepID=UPI000B81DA36|nr:bile acid:sodium symporter family protein [Psychrobacillus psychrodurans]